jgi:hypothetical protein
MTTLIKRRSIAVTSIHAMPPTFQPFIEALGQLTLFLGKSVMPREQIPLCRLMCAEAKKRFVNTFVKYNVAESATVISLHDNLL